MALLTTTKFTIIKGYVQILGLDYGDTSLPLFVIFSLLLSFIIGLFVIWTYRSLSSWRVARRSAYGTTKFYILQQLALYVGCIIPSMVWINLLGHELVESPLLLEFGMTSEVYHLVFHLQSLSRLCNYLIVYVDDIVIIVNDSNKILHLKSNLRSQFQT